MEILQKSANLSNFSNINSDVKVFFNETSNEKDDFNLISKASTQSKPKVSSASSKNYDGRKFKTVMYNDPKYKLYLGSPIDRKELC